MAKRKKTPPKKLTIKQITRVVVPILKRNGVKRAGIFGSYATGTANKQSDIDLLIKIGKRKFSLLDHVHLEQELEERLGKKVDLLTYSGINHLLKDRILGEELRIL